MIETTRLRIRLLRNDNLVYLVTLAGNWKVARGLTTMPHPYTEADGQEWIARVQQDRATGRPRRFAIALKEADRLIGGVGLDGSAGDESEEPAAPPPTRATWRRKGFYSTAGSRKSAKSN